jgi:hypothetical protein
MLITCQACGRRLTGHVGRYRHVDACPEFKAAAPRRQRSHSRNYDQRTKGESYPAEWYDGLVGEALRAVAVSSTLAAETVANALETEAPAIDSFAMARISRDREIAASRFVRDRDVEALQRSLARLDEEEATARSRSSDVVTADTALRYLRDLWSLWHDTEPQGRRAIAEAAFDRIDALGLDLVLHPSAEAERHGWGAAFGSEPLVCSIGQSGRGERHCPATTDLPVTMRLAEPPEPFDWLRSA